MKYKVLIVLLIAAFIVPVTPFSLLAQDGKIGYINSIKIFAEYAEMQEASKIYSKEEDAWIAEQKAKEQNIINLRIKFRDELKTQSPMLSEAKKIEKEREMQLELDRLMKEYEQFMEETFGEDGLAAKRNKELTQPIDEKINKVLEEIGKDEGYTIILDIANAAVVYADKEMDLTDLVLEKLNAKQ